MKIRVCYENIEEILDCEDMLEAVESFLGSHENVDAEEMTVTEVGSFFCVQLS